MIFTDPKQETGFGIFAEVTSEGVKNAMYIRSYNNRSTFFCQLLSNCLSNIYLLDPDAALERVKRCLKPGGVLVIEDADAINHGIFSYPDTPVIAQWCDLFQAMLKANNLSLKFSDTLYHRFQKVRFNNIRLVASQPLITNAEDKKVFHLAVLAGKQSILEKNVMNEAMLQDFISRLKLFEQGSNLIGFSRNILISGKK